MADSGKTSQTAPKKTFTTNAKWDEAITAGVSATKTPKKRNAPKLCRDSPVSPSTSKRPKSANESATVVSKHKTPVESKKQQPKVSLEKDRVSFTYAQEKATTESDGNLQGSSQTEATKTHQDDGTSVGKEIEVHLHEDGSPIDKQYLEDIKRKTIVDTEIAKLKEESADINERIRCYDEQRRLILSQKRMYAIIHDHFTDEEIQVVTRLIAEIEAEFKISEEDHAIFLHKIISKI